MMGGSEFKSVPTLDIWFWYEGKSGERPGDNWHNNSVKSCDVKQLKKTAEQHHITHLILEGGIPEHLDQLVPSLTHLKISRLPKQDHQMLESIGELSNLKELWLYCNRLTHLPESFGELRHLQKLNLSNNQLTHLPESIGKLSNLQKLDLYNNKLTQLPESIREFSNLQKLLVSCNRLIHLPDSIGELSNLQELYLSHNQLAHLPKSIGKLSNLQMLFLRDSKLTNLPESIGELSNLQRLDMRDNQLAHLSDSIGKLSNLQELNLFNNQLAHLPESIGKLSNLQMLYLFSNQLTHLPESIIKLSKLTKLDVEGCNSLHTPPLQVCKQGIGAIKQYFKDLARGQGRSLPAATIAVMGEKTAGKTSLIRTLQSKGKKRVLTVRQPETDRDDAPRVFNVEEVPTEDMILKFIDVGGHEVYHSTYPLTLRDSCVPGIVINLMKYSILSTDKDTGKIEAVRSLCFDTISQFYISNPKLGPPLLILTHIDQFDNEQGFACARDDFLKQCELLRQRMLQEDQKLVGKLDGHFWKSDIPLFHGSDIFCIGGKNESFQVFENIIDTLRLRCNKFIKIVPAIWEMIAETLSSSSKPYIKFAELLQTLSESDDIDQTQLEFVLIYLNECGKILWYPKVVALKPYVFQGIPELTKLLCVLFAHDEDTKSKTRLSDESSDGSIVEHEEYQVMYQRFRTSGIIDADLLLHLIKSESSFTSDTDTVPALAILCQFRLIYGPSKFVGRLSYLSPYFAVGYQSKEFLTTDGPVRMRSQMSFNGFTIPRYVYGRMSLDVIHLLSDDLSDDISPTQNGLTIHLGHLSIRFTHDFKSRKASLEIATGIEYLTEGRNLMQKLMSAIKYHVETAWPATRIVSEITCTHCLLRADPHPKKMINPTWLSNKHPKTHPMKTMICQGEKKIPACLIIPCGSLTKENMEYLKSYVDMHWKKGAQNSCNDSDTDSSMEADTDTDTDTDSPMGAGNNNYLDVEDLLILKSSFEILQLPEKDRDHLHRSVDELRIIEERADVELVPEDDSYREVDITTQEVPKQTAGQTSGSAVSLVYACEDDDSDLSDGEGLECDNEIRIKPKHTWKKRIKSLFFNTDKVYEMSKQTRGRALIINVERFNGEDAVDLTRFGSSIDVKNMKFMLKQFGFELAPVRENLDAQEILDAVKEETRHKNHEDYNLFFLCVMTHGKEDDQILGSDQHTVKLKNIYELLSPPNFPAMAGKPKIIVIQACTGIKRDLGKTGSISDSPDVAEPQDEPDISTRPKVPTPSKSAAYRSDNAGPSSNDTDSPTEAGSINNLDVEDLLILKSSFENYSSMRSEKSGSVFIRSLVVTFYKHACHRDLYSLCEIIQHRVSTESKILACKYPKYCFGQTVVAIKTFTRLRKVYLFPGYEPRTG